MKIPTLLAALLTIWISVAEGKSCEMDKPIRSSRLYIYAKVTFITNLVLISHFDHNSWPPNGSSRY